MSTDPHTLKAIALGAIHVYSFDEASGDLIDHAGSDDGTVSGTPDRLVNDQRGVPHAMGFDNTDDYVTLTGNPLNGLSAYTIEVIVRADAIADSDIFIDTRDAAGDGVRYYGSSTARLQHNASLVDSATNMPEGEWSHIHGCWTGTSLCSYLNGVGGTPAADSSALSMTTPARIGARSFTSPSFLLSGAISQLAIYDKALTQGEIDQLIAAGLSLGSSTLRRGKLSGIIGQPLRGRL